MTMFVIRPLSFMFFFFTFSFLVWPHLPTDCRSRGLFLLLITLCRIPLDEWSASCSDLCQTTHNVYNRQTSVSLALFEPAIPVMERRQTHALDRPAVLSPHKCQVSGFRHGIGETSVLLKCYSVCWQLFTAVSKRPSSLIFVGQADQEKKWEE